jgi:hypothetical protein
VSQSGKPFLSKPKERASSARPSRSSRPLLLHRMRKRAGSNPVSQNKWSEISSVYPHMFYVNGGIVIGPQSLSIHNKVLSDPGFDSWQMQNYCLPQWVHTDSGSPPARYSLVLGTLSQI